MIDPKYTQLEYHYKLILQMIADHDLTRPVEPDRYIEDNEIIRKKTDLEYWDAKTKWSIAFGIWREHLEALQYGAREANNAILKFRFDEIMSRRG